MAERTADVQAHWTRPGVLARIDAALAELGQDPQILTPEILATVDHLHSGGLAATRSVPLVRQHGQRVKLDSFLMQLLGLVRRGLAVNRAALDLAVVHLARLFGKSPPNIIGVSDEMI